jgi:hypothetical protein
MSTLARRESLPGEPPPREGIRARSHGAQLARELVLVPSLYFAYTLGRHLSASHLQIALAHARAVWNLERDTGLIGEGTVQQMVLSSPNVISLADLHYQIGYIVSLVGMLVWLYIRHPIHYLWFRRLLTIVTALGLLIQIVYPMAPPRLLPGDGVVDTAQVFGHAVYGQVGQGLSNQFAAMPSLHVGWAVVAAVGVIAVLRSRWRWLAVLHPIITLWVVVVTGNHFWMDGIVATAIVAVSVLVMRPWFPSATPAPAP